MASPWRTPRSRQSVPMNACRLLAGNVGVNTDDGDSALYGPVDCRDEGRGIPPDHHHARRPSRRRLLDGGHQSGDVDCVRAGNRHTHAQFATRLEQGRMVMGDE